MKTVTEAKTIDNLEEILITAWQMLAYGATKAKDPFHTPVLGSASPGGCSLRTVVLQRVLAENRVLICHTDRRSDKVGEIRDNPRVSWLFYHPTQKVQLRLVGQAVLHFDDELADQQWAASKLMSRRCYCVPDGPGTPSEVPTSGLPEFLQARSPSQSESELGRKNFAVIACRVDYLEWLYLSARGHRRAQFRWTDDGVSARWVAP